MRKLTIYNLVDTSQSMFGKHIEQIEFCINNFLLNIRTNLTVLEIGEIKIITYGENIAKIFKYIRNKDLFNYKKIKFECSGYSNFKDALEYVKNDHLANFVLRDDRSVGDWKPMLFVFTGNELNQDIDLSLFDFFEERFMLGSSEFTISNYSENQFLNRSPKLESIMIVTSENLLSNKIFKSKFNYIFSYDQPEEFLNTFDGFFKSSNIELQEESSISNWIIIGIIFLSLIILFLLEIYELFIKFKQ
jgi:uncharacterized protein YegL